MKKIVRTSIKEDTITKPATPITKPGVRPKKPSPIRRNKPSINPKPKASEEDVAKKFMALISEPDIVNENMQIAKQILQKKRIDVKNPQFQELKQMLQKNMGLLGQFTEWMFNKRNSILQLKGIYMQYVDAKRRNLKLDKIEDFETSEKFGDHMTQALEMQAISQITKSNIHPDLVALFNKDIVKLLKSNLDIKKEIIKYLGSGSRGEDSIFGAGGTKWKSSKELYDDLLVKIKELKVWNIGRYIKWYSAFDNEIAEILSTENDILVVDLKKYKALKDSSDEGYAANSWCIATNEGTFNSYIGSFNKQYIICNFNLDVDDVNHKIATTLTINDGVKEACDVLNHAIKNPVKYFEKLGL